jgi:hypothetical protein
MSELEPFQQATVEAALACLAGDGPRRFLVADEVGLGKTMIAREVARRLKGKREGFNLLYLCPSLEIAGQNRPKFVSLTGIEEKDYIVGEDRLSLVPTALPKEGNGFRIFTFTPGTSLPGWKPGPRTGRKAERELIGAVIAIYPRLAKRLHELDSERAWKSNTKKLLPGGSASFGAFSKAGLDRALRDVFPDDDQPFQSTVLKWLERPDTGIVEFIGRARAALALAALRLGKIRPDLVILDEFHRYADLILPTPHASGERTGRERAKVHRLLIDALLNGTQRPAVLLLSATPYRLRRLSGEDVHPVEHYRALIDLAGFLANDPEKRNAVEIAMRAYQDALRRNGEAKAIADMVLAAKHDIEALLRPIISRTERALVHEQDLFERPAIEANVETPDLALFRHFARAASSADARLKGWVPALWASIPYPTQTLHGYALWPTLRGAAKPPVEAGSGRGPMAHPQLRKLAALAGGSGQLSLPWQPPTIPWWRLEAAWAPTKIVAGKTLLFSRWKAAPTAISALLSLQLAGGLRPPGTKPPVALLRPGGGDASALVALFAPWPTLSSAIEPTKSGSTTIIAVARQTRRDLEDFLRGESVRIDATGKRPTWLVACGVERYLSAQSFRRLANAVLGANTGTGTGRWDRVESISRISPAELTALARHLLSAPGAIIARCCLRHGISLNTAKEVKAVFGFSWGKLRAYLGHRSFAGPIRAASGRKRYTDALCEATLKGGFEAVLDEQMGILRQLGDHQGLQIVEELTASLMDRPSLVRLRRQRRDYRVPVQAVVPFSGGEQRRSAKNKSGKLRSDGLRKAFNSPFWPHILCTTSVGQEGLDFHLWCNRIVHWDLPSDPVDFEQREGRIARYASLAVRVSLARRHAGDALLEAGRSSPFTTMLGIARRQPATDTGLERWWLPADGSPVSISFDWKFSLKAARKELMLKDLLYYRLALGQPDPEAFTRMLRNIGAEAADARRLAIDLAAISRPLR